MESLNNCRVVDTSPDPIMKVPRLVLPYIIKARIPAPPPPDDPDENKDRNPVNTPYFKY